MTLMTLYATRLLEIITNNTGLVPMLRNGVQQILYNFDEQDLVV